MSEAAPAARLPAVLVGVQLPDVSDDEHQASMAELSRLVHTLGYAVVGMVSQRRGALASGTVLGEGKLKELARYTGGLGYVPSAATKKTTKARERFEGEIEEDDDYAYGEGGGPFDDGDDSDPSDAGDGEGDSGTGAQVEAKLVVVDHEITPTQLRNLEKATGALVLDRTGVIVDIFHRHAKSREARLQVEIARLNYVAPRMRESTGGSERQKGKGAGESALELDRRKVRDRIAELREELVEIQRQAENRRYARRDQLRVALVGYTNAGKSSLMRALTGSEVLVADKLFATLDTTIRALAPATKPRILVSDTVGFIKKLPHDLVASFRSTLDEALEASLVLYVVDAADPTHESQLELTQSVLAEIGADLVASRVVLNKCDRLDADARAALQTKHPEAIMLSAHDPADVQSLHDKLVAFFDASMEESDVFVPYAKQKLLGEMYETCRVVAESHEETGTRYTVRALPAALARLRSLLA